MSEATHSSPKKDSTRLFKPVQLYDKLILAVVGIAALIGFIILLAHFAQPTPPGLSVENRQPKAVVAITDSVSAGPASAASIQVVQPSSSTAVGSSPTAPVISSTPAATAPATGTISTKAPITTQSKDLENTTGVVKQVVNNLQPSLNLVGLHL